MRLILRRGWTIAAIVAATALYLIACSGSVYELTSPNALSFHVLLRKTYSIVAFALVGYLFRRAQAENGGRHVVVTTILGVALYSAAIEVGQYFHGSREGPVSNAFDTFCGAIGGTLATVDLIRKRIAR